MYLDATDEDASNWMMFVRPAQSDSEMNMRAYESNGDVYFVTTKCLQNNQELRVGYAPQYAERYGLPQLPKGIKISPSLFSILHIRSYALSSLASNIILNCHHSLTHY